MSWGAAKARAEEKSGGSGPWIRLKEAGADVRFAIIPEAEPHERFIKFTGGKSVACSPDDPEAKCEIMVCVYDVDAKCSRILSLSARYFKKVADVVEANPGAVYKLVRLGVDKKTDYACTKAGPLSADTRRIVERSDVIDLTEFGATPIGAAPAEDAPASDDQTDQSVPF
jgi:hypothetical protein